MESFEIALIGVVLVAFTVVSRRTASSPITMPIVFVGAGALLAAFGVVEITEELRAIGLLAEVTLAVILFSDSTRISLHRLRMNIGLPIRLLGVGLPLTIAFGTGINVLFFPSLPIAEALLLAAILAPTDAALGSSVVSDPSVPLRERLALNVESGLNDGLVVPFVAVATSAVLGVERSAASWVGFLAEQIGFGIVIGVVAGYGGVTSLRRSRAAGWSDGRYEQIATFAIPILAFALSSSINGNGFIAAFVAGLTFGTGGYARLVPASGEREANQLSGPHEAEHLAEFTEDGAELLAAVTFFVFGNLFVDNAIDHFGAAVLAASVASLTVVRIVPVFIAMFRSGCDTSAKLFVGWFGPRGLASIVFAILLLEDFEDMSEGADQLVGVVALTVTLSVILHGASAAVGARRYGAHAAIKAAEVDTEMNETDVNEMAAAAPRTRWSPSRNRQA